MHVRYLILGLAVGLIIAPVIVRADSLSSPAEKHRERIRQLGDDSWLELGQATPDPQWGHARGRNWTSKMPYAAELGGAFLFGEGVHGWHNPKTGRYMDDLWFYDATSHRWVNLYPGFNVADPPVVTLNEDGFTSIDGKPVPIATMVHGYDMVTWDPDTRRFLSMPAGGTYWRKKMPAVHELLRQNRARVNRLKASPWLFDMSKKEWGRLKTSGRSPRSSVGDTLAYIPLRKEVFFRRKKKVWFYNPKKNEWRRVKPGGQPPPFGIDANSCLDSSRKRLYLGGGKFPVASGPNALWIYDLEGDQWVDPRPEGSPAGNSFSTKEALLHCDLANDVVILFRHRNPGMGIFVYDPSTNAWETVSTALPDGWLNLRRRGAVNGFYDSKLNVHIFHVAGESRDDGRFFAYRYRN